jgi:cyanophycin synthetase
MRARRAKDHLLPGVALVARAGRRGRTVAMLIESTRLVGPAPLFRASRDLRRLGSPGRAGRDAVYARIWQEAAAATGAEFRDCGRGFFELSKGARQIPVFHQITPIDDAVTLRRALEKPLVYELIAAAGVTIPEHVEFAYDDPEPALRLLRETSTIVVKPANETAGGEGVTTSVRSPADLARARLRAGTFGAAMLAERQAPGPLHRLLLLDAELIDTIVEQPPHVVGDGGSTVEQLMAAENHRRVEARGAAGMNPCLPDLDTAVALRDQGLSLRDVPDAGQAVQVKTVTNDRRIEDARTYRGEVHPDVLEQARAATAAVGLRLSGVDVIAPRIDRPLAETGGVVLEVNGTPGIHRHYQVSDGAGATRVAISIAERLFE